ncbi:MAG: tRNA (adenosine(37)-N6)-threonylcarbamoyltransferase complex ATPase subunit type 1 TsaE [Patescibacteria group bacterium]|jgi:tRNA threonylcarbamoyladenosine biosynthesis protein TsaE
MTKKKQQSVTLPLANLQATKALAVRLAKLARGGDVFGLVGNLGAGKTTFTQFFAAALGVKSRVISPTYTLVQFHAGKKFTLCHIDSYRAHSAEEICMAGLDDALADKNCIVIVEWADTIAPALPPHTTWLQFSRQGTKRTVTITTP